MKSVQGSRYIQTLVKERPTLGSPNGQTEPQTRESRTIWESRPQSQNQRTSPVILTGITWKEEGVTCNWRFLSHRPRGY